MDASFVAHPRRKSTKLSQDVSRSLSNLPDDILYSILSFLPMKDAVKTSVLSKRWSCLWTFMPKVEFNEAWFKKRPIFMKFVEKALFLRGGASIKSFSLSCKILHDAPRINLWITAAIRSNVEELSLSLTTLSKHMCPGFIFRSETLTKFHLSMNGTLGLPPSIHLPKLKILKLTLLTIVEDNTAVRLLTFPLLEKLFIGGCTWKILKTIRIVAPNLRELSIDDLTGVQHAKNIPCDREVQILAVSLKSFYYIGALVNEYSISGSSLQLVEAGITFGNIQMGPEFDTVAKHGNMLLNGLSTTKKLTLSHGVYEVLAWRDDLLDRLPVFRRLVELKSYASGHRINCKALSVILQKCPHLITLQFDEVYNLGDPKASQLLDPIPLCFTTQLKTITVCYFAATEDEIFHLGAFLKHAMVLKEIVVYFAGDVRRDEVLELLRAFPCGSRKCKIWLIPISKFGTTFSRVSGS